MSINEEKIHVLYVITKLELGGAQKVCLSLLKGIKKSGNYGGLVSGSEGVLVDSVAADSDVYLLKEFKRDVGIPFLFSELKTVIALFRLMRTLKKKYPQLIVHTHSTKAGILGRWVAFFAGIKVRVHTVHGFGFHEYQPKIIWTIHFFLEWLTSLITTHYVCVSIKDRELGKKKIPFFSKKSSIIRAAVDWDAFYIPAKKEVFLKSDDKKTCVIGTVSCFKPQKNLGDLLKAFKMVVERGVTKDVTVLLQIIGDGVMREQLQAWVDENNLTEKVFFLGWQRDVARWMKQWDIFAMSSLWEGLPCAVVEARLCKLPVVSYGVGGVDEIVTNGRNGFVVPAGDWQTLAQLLARLVYDNGLCKTMGNYNDNLAAFHNQEMVRQHIDLYKQIVDL